MNRMWYYVNQLGLRETVFIITTETTNTKDDQMERLEFHLEACTKRGGLVKASVPTDSVLTASVVGLTFCRVFQCNS